MNEQNNNVNGEKAGTGLAVAPNMDTMVSALTTKYYGWKQIL